MSCARAAPCLWPFVNLFVLVCGRPRRDLLLLLLEQAAAGHRRSWLLCYPMLHELAGQTHPRPDSGRTGPRHAILEGCCSGGRRSGISAMRSGRPRIAQLRRTGVSDRCGSVSGKEACILGSYRESTELESWVFCQAAATHGIAPVDPQRCRAGNYARCTTNSSVVWCAGRSPRRGRASGAPEPSILLLECHV